MTDEISADIKVLGDLIEAGATEGILEYCGRRFAEGSTNPYLFLAMGMVSFFNDDAGLAIQVMERGHALNPDCRELVDGLAAVHTRLGRLTDGLYYGKLAVCLTARPDTEVLLPAQMASYMAALRNVSISHHATNAEAAYQLGMLEEARVQAERHLRIHPDDVDCMVTSARTLLALARPSAAAAMLRAALHHRRDDPRLHALLGEALMAQGRHASALAHQRLAWERAGDAENEDKLRAQLAGALTLQSDLGLAGARAVTDAYVEDREAPRRRVKAEITLEAPLTGVMWDQVHQGPLMDCVLPVARKLSKLVLYILNPNQDPMTEALRAVVLRARRSVAIDDATMGRIVGGDQVGCLINLCAPSEHARFPVFKGERPPVVVHWITYPMCDRLPGATLVLSDAETAPVDRRTYGDDKVVELSTLLAFDFPRSLAAEDEVLELPRNTRGYVMFGVHGESSRFTEETAALWARVLWAVRGSRLLIGGRDDWEPELAEWVLETFAEYGLANRVHLQEPVEDKSVSPARVFAHMVDVVLDTSPVNGIHETAMDLWMGLPVVTLRGDRRVGRTGASVLRAAGRPDWIADTPGQYVEIAARLALASDLGGLRASLRGQVLASPLADPAALGVEIAGRLAEAVAALRAKA